MRSRALSSRSISRWLGRSASRPAAPVRVALAAVALLAAAILGVPAGAATEKRVALVIGNSAYQGLKPLKNPGNDAQDVAAALKARGFEVLSGVDLGQAEMRRLIERYSRAARDADVSLFYFAGHGFQVASQNYLVPVDAQIRAREDVGQRTLDLRSILAPLEGTRGIHLVFLDACRNNPLKGAGGGQDEGLQNGLARVGNKAGFLIAYATQPDNVAFDGGGRNSPFATAVLSHVATPGQDVGAMMIAVRKDVLAATGGFQVPLEESSLTRQFYFAPGRPSASPETTLWQLAAAGPDPSLLRIYLSRFPEGAHAAEVRSLLTTKVASLPDAGSARSAPVGAVTDDRLWELAQRSRMRPLVDFYLARNPDGRHAAEARELLASLPDEGAGDASPDVLCQRTATHPRDATANAAGVPLGELARNAGLAIEACEKARAQNPELPLYTALLARAKAAAGRRDEAVALYREAAGRGDLRAMVSLGLLTETGDGVPRDAKAAAEFYARAAERGSPDGAINLAVALMSGAGVPRDPARAVALLTQAAAGGSAIATYNLGVLAQDRVAGQPAQALDHFKKATELGDPRGFVAAAILLDEGRGVAKNPEAAAEMLLQGVSSDSGEALAQLTTRAASWSAPTVRAIQARLKQAGYYPGAIDGKGGPKLAEPLRRWRRVGTLELASR